MKRKYYLRGLGTGILVTALILIIASGQKKTMTDEEVRARAKELGMVESTLLSELANQTPTDTAEPDTPGTAPELTAEPEDTLEPTPEPTAEPGDTAEPTTEPAAEPEDTAEPTPEPAAEPAVAPTAEPKTTEEPETTAESILLVIRSGESSVSVSKALEEAGLVASAQAYDRYLCENGYDKKIRSGEHRIPVGADEAEIAAIITSGKR